MGDFGVSYTEVGRSRGIQGQELGGFQDVHHTFIAPNPTPVQDAAPIAVPGINPYEDAEVKPFDMPSFSSMGGIVITLHHFMLVISLLICLGRPDLNLVFYLMGYYLWCIHGHRYKRKVEEGPDTIKYPHTAHVYVASKTTVRVINHYTIALTCALAFDFLFLFIGYESFVCKAFVTGSESPITDKCVIELSQLQYSTRLVQRWSYFWMMINTLLKAVCVGLSFAYVSQQKKHAKSLGITYTGLR